MAVLDAFVKSARCIILAHAGIYNYLKLIDSRLNGNENKDEISTFCEFIIFRRGITLFYIVSIHKRSIGPLSALYEILSSNINLIDSLHLWRGRS
jgi:hypothetical protein